MQVRCNGDFASPNTGHRQEISTVQLKRSFACYWSSDRLDAGHLQNAPFFQVSARYVLASDQKNQSLFVSENDMCHPAALSFPTCDVDLDYRKSRNTFMGSQIFGIEIAPRNMVNRPIKKCLWTDRTSRPEKLVHSSRPLSRCPIILLDGPTWQGFPRVWFVGFHIRAQSCPKNGKAHTEACMVALDRL